MLFQSNALTAALAEHLHGLPPGPCQLNIAHKARHETTAVVELGEQPIYKPVASIGSFAFGRGEQTARGWLVPTDRPIAERRPFVEDIIWKDCVVEGKEARLSTDLPFTPAELIVSITKKLHHSLMPPATGCHWAVTRFVLSRPFESNDTAPLAIEFETSIGVTLTRCAVRSHDKAIGHIFFSLAPL